MADNESIKTAIQAAEERAAWALNAAAAVVEASADPYVGKPPSWVAFHERQIGQLAEAIEGISRAFHGGSDGR